MQLIHICEVCGVFELLDCEKAHEIGWDYPPKMGVFGVISPRTCPNCPINKTLWWRISVEGLAPGDFTAKDREIFERIAEEPESILPKFKI